VSNLEVGGPLIYKTIIDIIMHVKDSVLHSLTHRLEKLRLTDDPGKNVGTAVSYLKGALLLL